MHYRKSRALREWSSSLSMAGCELTIQPDPTMFAVILLFSLPSDFVRMVFLGFCTPVRSPLVACNSLALVARVSRATEEDFDCALCILAPKCGVRFVCVT